MIYSPKKDSFFLVDFLKQYLETQKKDLKVLDMGTGSCIQAETISKFIDKKNILCVDINPEAIEIANLKGFYAIQSDLFFNISEKFDLIIFNAPYLPEHKFDKQLDTTGGKKGDETIIRFLKQIKNNLNKNGKIILLLSSLTPKEKINQIIEDNNIKIISKKSKKIFFETLEIWVMAV